jgi:outer membrane lipoprotein SlyB
MEINQVPNTAPASASSPAYQPGFANRMQHSKALVAIVAVLGVTVMALAAALVVNRSEAQPGLAASTPVPLVGTTPAPTTRLAAEAAKSVHPVVKRVTTQPVPAQSSHASFCADCATVEAVTAVQRQGQVNGVAMGNQTIGMGTVAGGLIGGLLGNQVGGGNGKTLATVAGVAGGAFAGNTIEKNMKQVTVYDVRLRMDDGSRRHMEVSSTVPVGSKVIVEGKNLRMANTAG